MKVWMVLALLAMGLGCSEEPQEPPPTTTTVAPTTTTVAPTTTTVDDGPSMVEVPSVIGDTIEFASGRLKAIGSPVIVGRAYELMGDPNIVVEQLPLPGSSVVVGSPVVLKVAGFSTLAYTEPSAEPTTSTTTQPPRSEQQWSHLVRQPFFVGCVNGEGSLMALGRSGVTSRNVCRCLLDELERRFSESDFQLLSEEERTDALRQASTVCIDRLQGDYCRDRVSAECPVKP